MSDMMGHLEKYQRLDSLYSTWEGMKSEVANTVAFLQERGADYEEASLFMRMMYHAIEAVNPWSAEAVQYWVAVAYDRVEEWKRE